jgi:Oxysterol-binding protein
VQNIHNSNETEALKEKTIVEEHQRALERERKAKDLGWTPKLFTKVKEDNYVYKSLSQVRYVEN